MFLNVKDDGISRQLAIKGTREQQLKYIIEKSLKSGHVVCDLGANIGYYSIMMAKIVGPLGIVYAIEPSPENHELLLKNIQLNGMGSTIETHKIGVSNRKGTARFYLSAYSNLHTLAPKSDTSNYRTLGTTDDNYIEVPITDISSFVENKRPFDLLRMDIEGVEVEVIEGMQKAIEKNAFMGKILFETHKPKYSEDSHSIRKQLCMLFDNGYKTKMVSSNDDDFSKLKEKYNPIKRFQISDFRTQSVYENISEEDTFYYLCDVGGVRDILLGKD